MKNSLFGLLLLVSVTVFAQTDVSEKFKQINTVEQAQQYIDANPVLKPAMFDLTTARDTSLIQKRILKQHKGDVFSVGYTVYKIVKGTENVAYRANYIFLDGGELSPSQLDSMRKLIVQKASSGVPFEKLSDDYTMDGNNTHGDTGWFFGEEMLPKEFQDAVKNHKTGEIFFVDVPDKDWHYVVKKTYDDREKKEMTVLKSVGR